MQSLATREALAPQPFHVDSVWAHFEFLHPSQEWKRRVEGGRGGWSREMGSRRLTRSLLVVGRTRGRARSFTERRGRKIGRYDWLESSVGSDGTYVRIFAGCHIHLIVQPIMIFAFQFTEEFFLQSWENFFGETWALLDYVWKQFITGMQSKQWKDRSKYASNYPLSELTCPGEGTWKSSPPNSSRLRAQCTGDCISDRQS